MFHIEDKELNAIAQAEYQRGVAYGIKLMERKMLLASESGGPIEIEGRAYFVKTDVQNLRGIFADIERKSKI